MTGVAVWPPQLVALVESMAGGRPLEALTWRDLLPIRERVDSLLNAEVNRRQAPEAVRGGAT